MSASQNIEALPAGKKPKSHVPHDATRSKPYKEAHVESRPAPPSGYQPAAPTKQSGYIGAAPVEHITDENGNVLSDEEFVSLLGNFHRDSGYSSNLSSYDASLDAISRLSSPTPLAPSGLAHGFLHPQEHSEISHGSPNEATKDGTMYAPNLAGTCILDVVDDNKYNIPSQERHKDNEATATYQGEATPDFVSKVLSESQAPVYPALPQSLYGTSPSSQLQSRKPSNWKDRNSQNYGAHREQSIVRQSQPENVSSHHLDSGNSWTYDASSGVRQDYGVGATQHQGGFAQRNAQQSTQDLPLQSIESDSEYSANGVAPTPTPDERELSTRKPPGAAGKRQSESTPRGDTRERNGQLQCNHDGEWKYAVRLDEIRARINAEEKRKGTYDYPWAKGKAKNDETSYHSAYKAWGWERDQRPEILFQFERNNYRAPSYPLKTWIDRDRVVLDPDDNPIILWREIPLLCSSNMSGAELEAISRTNPDIPLSALRARMPAQIMKGRKWRPLFDLNTLRMRMGRFRMKAGCIAWNEREGSKQIKSELGKILGPRCIRENSTLSFGRDLTTLEVDSLKAVNKGTVPQRSRKKGPTEIDDVSSFASTPRCQDTMLSPYSQEHSASPAPAVKFGAAFGGQGRARQLNNLVPHPQDQKRGWARVDSELSEDYRGFPSTKKRNAGPRGNYGDPYLQQSYGGSGYPQHGNPSSDFSSLPAPDINRHSRKHQRQWDPDTSDYEADRKNPSAPMKRRRLDLVPARPKRAMRPAVVDQRHPSQMEYSSNQPVDLDSDDEHYLLPEGNLDEGVVPFATYQPVRAFPLRAPQTEDFFSRPPLSESFQSSRSHQTIFEHPTLSFGTRNNLSGGPLGNDISLLPALQVNRYLFDEALGIDVTPSAAQLPANVLPRQALNLGQNHQTQHRIVSDLDFRYVTPSNTAEEEIIQEALSFTRDDFEYQSGDNPPDTSRNQSYEIQHQALQEAIANIWLIQDPPSDLFYFSTPWRSFDDWHAPKAKPM